MGKKIGSTASTKANEILRRAKHRGIRLIETDIESAEYPYRKSNSLMETVAKWIVAMRVREHINDDGSKMTKRDELEYREAHGYGTPAMLAKLRKELEGRADDEFADVSDEELLAAIEKAQAA